MRRTHREKERDKREREKRKRESSIHLAVEGAGKARPSDPKASESPIK
jgi:hypothetical protein